MFLFLAAATGILADYPWIPQVTATLCTVLTAAASVFIAYQAYSMTVKQNEAVKLHQRLSVAPYLTEKLTFNLLLGEYDCSILNCGSGPAIIETLEVKIDENLIDGPTAIEGAIRTLFADSKISFTTFEHVSAYGVAPKEVMILYKFKFKEAPLAYDIVETQLKRLRIKIRYESIYKEYRTFITSV